MRFPIFPLAAITIVASTAPAQFVAQTRGPREIRESEPGLMDRATFPPARARLIAFGEFPGAQMADAEIRMQDARLVYVFDLQFAGQDIAERIEIDALNGQVVSVEYVVHQGNEGGFAVMGPSDLVSMVEAVYPTARSVADAAAHEAKVVACRLRVEQARTVFVFDVEVGAERARQRVMVDARSGLLIAAQQP